MSAPVAASPVEAPTEAGGLPGSPQSPPTDKTALRANLSEKRRAQRSELALQTSSADSMLSSLCGVGLTEEQARLNAQTHRQVSCIVQEQKAQWDNTLRASRLLHEKVAQQLQNKSMRRRAQRDVIKRWTSTSHQSHTRAQRMMMCCGCSRGHNSQRSLSDRPLAEAATIFNSGNWSEALKAYDHALLMMGHSDLSRRAEAHLVRCECLLRLQDYATMETEADALLRTAGDHWAGYRMRGTARFYLGNTEQAREDYALALEHKLPSGNLGNFAGPCTAEAEAAIIADREQLVRQTAGHSSGGGGVERSASSEVREATEVTIGTS